MSRVAYVNGRYLRFRDAKVHVEDRGYQFADSVYEVCEVRGGRLIDERRHLDRLQRSLAALRIRMPMSRAALSVVLHEVVARNRISYGIVYLQLSRGVARREHAFPSPEVSPGMVVTARRLDMRRNEALAATGIAVVTVPDIRWGRVDIKTVGLLANVLARQDAIERGARDAWFVDAGGFVREATSANAWIVTPAGALVTRQADQAILRGITRTVLFDVIAAQKGCASKSAPSRWRKLSRRARLSSPRRARSFCRWYGSTAARSPMASRGRSLRCCGGTSIATPRPGRARLLPPAAPLPAAGAGGPAPFRARRQVGLASARAAPSNARLSFARRCRRAQADA